MRAAASLPILSPAKGLTGKTRRLSVNGRNAHMGEFRAFLSYARADDDGLSADSVVQKVYESLTSADASGTGGSRVFFDRHEMPARALSFTSAISDAIHQCDYFVLFIGENAPLSEYVMAEYRHAQRCGCVIFPVVYRTDLPDSKAFGLIPKALSARHAFDLRHPGTPRFDEEFARLIREVQAPVPPKGELYGVPSYDVKNYVVQMDVFDSVLSALFAKTPTGIEDNHIAAICGMAGSGKSSLAAYIVRDASVRRAFPDGVIWLNVTQSGTPALLWRQISVHFNEVQRDVIDDEVESEIHKIFLNRKALIVLDDVWSGAIATLFGNALGDTRNSILITTRDSSYLHGKADSIAQMQGMSKSDALLLLSRYANCDVSELPGSARGLAREVGYLPLALAIVGSMVSDGRSWDAITEAYKVRRKDFLTRFVNYYSNAGHESAFAAIQMSVDALDASLAPYYMKLAVFPKSEDIALAAVRTLWDNTLSEYETESIILDFKDKALLSYDSKKKTVRLHDLQCDYLLLVLNDICGLHSEFVEAYRRKTNGEWWDGTDDGYYFNHIIGHLLHSSPSAAQEAMECLRDYRWIKRKLEASGIASLEKDYRDPSAAYDEATLSILGFLEVSAHVLAENSDQLPSQLFGRLSGIDRPWATRLLQDAVTYTDKPWVRPLAQCMLPISTGLVSTMDANEWLMATFFRAGRLLTCDWAGCIREWDLESKGCTRIAQNGIKILDAVCGDDTLVTMDENHCLKWWDLQGFTATKQLSLDGLPRIIRREGEAVYVLWEPNGIGKYDFAGNELAVDTVPTDTVSFEVTPEGLLLFSKTGVISWYELGSSYFEPIAETDGEIVNTCLLEDGVLVGYANGKVSRLSLSTFEFVDIGCCSDQPRKYCLWHDGIVVGDRIGGLWYLDGDNRFRKLFDIGARVDCLASHDGRLLSGDSAGKLSLWDEGLFRAEEHDYRIHDVRSCVAQNGHLVVATRSGDIVRFDPVGLSMGETICESRREIRALSIVDDAIGFACADGSVFRIEGDSAEEIAHLDCRDIRNFASYAGYLYVVDKNGSLFRYDKGGAEEQVYDKESLITAVHAAFNKLLVADDFGMIRFEDERKEMTKTIREDIWIRSLASGGMYLASGDWFGIVRVYNRITGRCLFRYYADNAIDSLAFVGNRLFAVTKGGVLHCLDLIQGKSV